MQKNSVIAIVNEITNLTMIVHIHHLPNIYMHYSDSIQISEVEAQNLRVNPKQYAFKLSDQIQIEDVNLLLGKFIPTLERISEPSFYKNPYP